MTNSTRKKIDRKENGVLKASEESVTPFKTIYSGTSQPAYGQSSGLRKPDCFFKTIIESDLGEIRFQ